MIELKYGGLLPIYVLTRLLIRADREQFLKSTVVRCCYRNVHVEMNAYSQRMLKTALYTYTYQLYTT